MASDLLSFADRMERRAERLPEAVNEVTKELVTKIVTDLATVTPVDTSQALSNWQVGIGSTKATNIEPYSPGTFGSTQGASIAATIAAAETDLKGRGPQSVGNPVYITNALPYIQRLNEGYSRQAPAGYVQRSILLSRSILRDIKLKLV